MSTKLVSQKGTRYTLFISIVSLADLPAGEIIGGSQREDDLQKLSARAKEMGLPEESMAWYLDLRYSLVCCRFHLGSSVLTTLGC